MCAYTQSHRLTQSRAGVRSLDSLSYEDTSDQLLPALQNTRFPLLWAHHNATIHSCIHQHTHTHTHHETPMRQTVANIIVPSSFFHLHTLCKPTKQWVTLHNNIYLHLHFTNTHAPCNPDYTVVVYTSLLYLHLFLNDELFLLHPRLQQHRLTLLGHHDALNTAADNGTAVVASEQ